MGCLHSSAFALPFSHPHNYLLFLPSLLRSLPSGREAFLHGGQDVSQEAGTVGQEGGETQRDQSKDAARPRGITHEEHSPSGGQQIKPERLTPSGSE